MKHESYIVNVKARIHFNVDNPIDWFHKVFLAEKDGECHIKNVITHKVHEAQEVAPALDSVYFDASFLINIVVDPDMWVHNTLFDTLTYTAVRITKVDVVSYLPVNITDLMQKISKIQKGK